MFLLKGSKCPCREYLLIVCITMAVPKTAPIKHKISKIRYSFQHVVDLTYFYLIIKKIRVSLPEFLSVIDKGMQSFKKIYSVIMK